MFDAEFDRQKLMYHPDRVAEWSERGATSGPIHTEMDVHDCRDICRMDECNRHLSRLKHLWPHDNFI